MKVSIDNQIIIVLRVSIVDVIKYNVIHKLKIKIIYVPRTQVMIWSTIESMYKQKREP